MQTKIKLTIVFFTLSFLLLDSMSSYSQTNDRIESNGAYAEKIYLQLDANAYTRGNIVWFKCVVLNGLNHKPTELSRVLYVELITPEETIKEKKLIKIENGIGQGFFFLDKNMEEGLYQIRAYTEWDKNFDTDFFYTEYIHVFAHKINSSTESPISNVTLIKEENANRLTASFSPEMIDSLQKRKLTVIVSIDDNRDTLELKSDRDDQFSLEYPVGEDSHFATIQMLTETQKRFTKTLVLNEDILDLQFFPESGELVHGLQSRIGFKALDANGQGKKIEGEIVDENDEVITTFKSNILGMGSFVLNRADSTKNYYAKLQTSEEGEVLMYPLPKVAAKGNILAIERNGDNIMIAAKSNYANHDSVSLNISCRGMNIYHIQTVLHNGIASIMIPVAKLPEGIIAFTMKDWNKQVVAERLYFVEKPESRIDLALSTDKESYQNREETKLEIQANNKNGEPLDANLSVLVINKKQLGEIQSTRQNILSYFLLESELKGRIENPGYYFSSDTSHQTDLDALMLTQGWRKYHYAKDYDEFSYMAERSLTVKGYIGGYFFENSIRKQADLILIAFGKDQNKAYEKSTDSHGNFRFNLIDTYGGSIDAVIQTNKKNRNGKQVDYTVTLDENVLMPITFEHEKTVEKLDSVVRVLVEQNMERSKIDEAFPLDSGNILIEEVEVKAFELTPERKIVIEEYGEPDRIIEGKEIAEKEKNWSFGLYSVLMYQYPEIIRISVSPNGKMHAHVIGAGVTLWVVDGKTVNIEDESLLESFPISEIKSFEIIRHPKNFEKVLWEAGIYFPGLIDGAIIALYTHGAQGLFAHRAQGIMTTTIPVFSAPREFYAPKYDNVKEDDFQRPDLRALIHWAPVVETDSLGNASLSFYNADYSGDMMVVVEAVTPNGQIGYKELIYNVEGKEQDYIIVN